MRFFHLADLHIGKVLHGYSLYEVQSKVLDMIVSKADELRPDAIVVAGDIYDRSVPSGEAYNLFDRFLTELSGLEPSVPVMIIAGNHDNADRLKYAAEFMRRHKIYISVLPPQNSDEYLEKVILEDEYGPVNFYLLPFTKPSYVRKVFGEREIADYDSAFRAVIERENIDYSQRNVLVAHQFFTDGLAEPEKGGSELTYVSVGGIDNVQVGCVRNFDYVALGHIHGSQRIGEDYIRYSGTPYPYSVSEEKHVKSIGLVTIGAKKDRVTYEKIPLDVRPRVRSVRGRLADIIAAADDENRDDYLRVTLTDEEELFQPKARLEEHYSHITEIFFDNQRIREETRIDESEETGLDPVETFAVFFREMNGEDMKETEKTVILDIFEKLSGEEEEG